MRTRSLAFVWMKLGLRYGLVVRGTGANSKPRVAAAFARDEDEEDAYDPTTGKVG